VRPYRPNIDKYPWILGRKILNTLLYGTVYEKTKEIVAS
jgi:hypothetical protein